MGPAAIEKEAERIAKAHGGKLTVTKGETLEQGYPMIHAVGRAAAKHHAPRLIEIVWGKEDHPRVALVGKGISFDSGGLDIKPASGMRLMKKDMGGAAHVLALAQLIMESGLPVRLHCLIAAAENAAANVPPQSTRAIAGWRMAMSQTRYCVNSDIMASVFGQYVPHQFYPPLPVTQLRRPSRILVGRNADALAQDPHFFGRIGPKQFRRHGFGTSEPGVIVFGIEDHRHSRRESRRRR